METLDQAATTTPLAATSRIRRWAYRAALALAPLWALIRVAGLETNVLAYTPETRLLAFTPYVAVLSLVPLAVCPVRREWWPAGLALIATVVLAACVLSRAIGGGPVAAARPGGPALRVLTANLSLGEADAGAVVALVRTHHPDVVLLQEFTPEAEAAFDRAGIADLLPTG